MDRRVDDVGAIERPQIEANAAPAREEAPTKPEAEPAVEDERGLVEVVVVGSDVGAERILQEVERARAGAAEERDVEERREAGRLADAETRGAAGHVVARRHVLRGALARE